MSQHAKPASTSSSALRRPSTPMVRPHVWGLAEASFSRDQTIAPSAASGHPTAAIDRRTRSKRALRSTSPRVDVDAVTTAANGGDVGRRRARSARPHRRRGGVRGRSSTARIDRCYRLAWSILANDADAADATQDALVSAWRQLPRLRDPAAFDGWLNRIVANAALMARRHRVRLREVSVASGLPGRRNPTARTAAGPAAPEPRWTSSSTTTRSGGPSTGCGRRIG